MVHPSLIHHGVQHWQRPTGLEAMTDMKPLVFIDYSTKTVRYPYPHSPEYAPPTILAELGYFHESHEY